MSSNKKENSLPDFKGSSRAKSVSNHSNSQSGKSSSHSSSRSNNSYNNNGHYGGSYQGSYTASPKKAFEHDGIEYWGSSKTNLDKISLEGNDLLINCTGTSYTVKPFIKNIPEWLKMKAVSTEPVSQMLLDWKDYQPPPDSIGLEFWQAIIEQSKKHGIKRILCCCQAGHGRTGTALSSFALASGFKDEPDDAIDYIRECYKEKAVETKGQELYVWQLIYDLEDEKEENKKKETSDYDDEYYDEEEWAAWARNYDVS